MGKAMQLETPAGIGCLRLHVFEGHTEDQLRDVKSAIIKIRSPKLSESISNSARMFRKLIWYTLTIVSALVSLRSFSIPTTRTRYFSPCVFQILLFRDSYLESYSRQPPLTTINIDGGGGGGAV